MLNLNSQAIKHLAKLNRDIHKAMGVKHCIAQEKGILELLQFAREHTDQGFDDTYHLFCEALSQQERDSLGVNNPVDKEHHRAPTDELDKDELDKTNDANDAED